MNAQKDINRKVLAIKAKKKRRKPQPVSVQKNDPLDSDSSSSSSSSYSNSCSSDDSSSRDDEEEDRDTSEGEEQEDPKDYRRGGYHPVKIGDLFQSRYHVTRKLGWGYFSTVWLCWDLVEKSFVALKVVKSKSSCTETALDEIQLLTAVRDADVNDEKRNKVIQLLNDFKISGVNGTHICMVFKVLGDNLLKLIMKSNYKGIPLKNVKCIIRQVLEGLDYLHTKSKIIHTDIKPENVLICESESYIKRLACEATELKSKGIKLPISLISTAPKELPALKGKMSRNKKKKLKKKANRQNELLRRQLEQLKELETEELLKHELPCESEESVNNETFKVPDSDNLVSGNTTEDFVKDVKIESICKNDCSAVECSLKTNILSRSTGRNIEKVGEVNSKENLCSLEKEEEKPEERGSGEELLTERVSAKTGDSVSSQPDLGDSEMQCRAREGKYQGDLEVDPSVHECEVDVKIVDLGNACWVDKHFTEGIQTRQYRSPEVLLEAGYNTSADIWSTACLAVELATGEFLFEPHQGEDYSRDEDHLAQIIEVLGDIPKKIISAGKRSHKVFNRKGKLKHITELEPRSLYGWLAKRKRKQWTPDEIKAFSAFLLPMLDLDPNRRATAAQCLEHEWLKY